MDITAKLQMNFHPKDCENLSIVTARNIKLANDGSCLTNEESIKKNAYIENFLTNYYITQGGNSSYNIVGVIPCNNELVLICVGSSNTSEAQIFRYREESTSNDEGMKLAYGGTDDVYLAYHNGKIKGTFTYNVEDSLVVAIAEYDGDEKVPLRTINLGNYDDEDVYNDIELPDSILAVSPQVRLPNVSDLTYVAGNAYKGWYYMFIRFKINSIDYTQWYSIGFPIYVDSLETFCLTKYCYQQDQTGDINWTDLWRNIITNDSASDGYCVGASDYFSSTSEVANETFKVNINFPRTNNGTDPMNHDYEYYQIGVINANKSTTRAYRTADIGFTRLSANSSQSVEFVLNNASLIEASASDFIIDNNNYFDVGNIITYKNRLYVANYKENSANDRTIADSGIIDNIDVTLSPYTLFKNEVSYDYPILGKQVDGEIAYPNQYEGNDFGTGPSLAEFCNVSDDTEVSITCGTCTTYNLSSGSSSTSSNTTLTTTAGNAYVCPEDTVYSTSTTPTSNYPSYFAIKFISGSTAYVLSGTITIEFTDYTNTAQTITIDEGIYAVNGTQIYINVSKTFDNRRQNSFLIPGEVYNFFIHFVDKYGHVTNGYKLENKYTWHTANNTSTAICPVPFVYNGSRYYAAVPIDNDVTTDGTSLNTSGITYWNSITDTRTLTGSNTNSAVAQAFADYYGSFADSKYVDVKWYQIASTQTNAQEWLPYYNTNGDSLFRVPIFDDSSTYLTVLSLNIRNVSLPDGYIGWFISYELFEPIKRVTGVLTRNDFRTQDYVENSGFYNAVRDTANTHKSNYMYFYSGQYDIADSIRLDYNIMRIEAMNCWHDDEDIPHYDFFQRSNNFKFCWDMNKPESRSGDGYLHRVYAAPDYKLCVADSAADARMGLGTALQLKDSYSLFPVYDTDESTNSNIKLYKVTFLNATRDIYLSENKTLVRCSEVIYNNTSATSDSIHLNGYLTYDGVIVYANEGMSFNTSDNVVRRTNDNTRYYPEELHEEYSFEENAPFLAYMQFYVIDTYFYEAKSFKNEPTGYIFYVHQDEDDLDAGNENNKFQSGCIVTPANSVDLFENRSDTSDTFNTKTYTNYREDLVSIDEFNKTVRRSAVIADETRENGWRTFPTEGYKNIIENKGIITNLIGIGTYLIVHTQHSLFMFNTDNTLTTNNSQQVQLAQQDAFDVDYIEVITSALGYGGLQDDKSFVLDQFGYTFYNNDFHRFFNFDNGQINVIDDDIILWLDRYKPYNVRFANDKFNNRLLIKMNYQVGSNEKEVVMSYNYGTNHFISVHDYSFDEAYNTKAKLYFQCASSTHANCSFHQFIHDGTFYGSFDNVKSTIGIDTTYPSQLGIIINPQFDSIKFLEHITYKLVKCANPANVDYTNSPVEEYTTPYSADNIRVYNNEVDTGTLDILIDSEDSKNIFCNYTKPYWELGNWNFSYLRNNIVNYGTYGDAFIMSRIYGNYFVIDYTFSNSDNLKVEFEELKYAITI